MLLGISGGIAAYKMPDFVRMLKKKGIDVRVVMTRSAEKFVTPLTMEAVSGNKVWVHDWSNQDDPLLHLSESLHYDMALIAPATANIIGKLAGGIADDPLTTISLALVTPPYIAPSMNPRMYNNSAVKENLLTLKRRGCQIIQPDEGDMACGEAGEGRLPGLERLLAIVEHGLGLENDLEGKKIVVTAGRTEEPIDSVRYISNRSSGKMGIAIAIAAAERGADVTLIHGSISEPLPETTKNIGIRQAEEMFSEVSNLFPSCDILIMAAAVADFRPAKIYDSKIKKETAEMTIPLSPNPDILKEIGIRKKGQFIVGFAAETDNWIQNAREKMLKKNIDLICLNDVSRNDIGFDSEFNELTFISRTQELEKTGRLPKRVLAQKVLDKVTQLSGSKDSYVLGKGG